MTIAEEVKALMEAKGCSRSTAYREVKQNRKSVVTVEPPAAATQPLDETATASVAWAQDIMWAYANAGRKITKRSAGSPQRFANWQSATEDFNAFNNQLVRQALKILDEAKGKTTPQGASVKTALLIADLKELLKGAVEEARSK